MTVEPLFHGKPWEFRGRKMERNAPRGTRCTPGCSHPRPTGNRCLCTVCHEVFSGVTAFDNHRKDGWCLDPSAIGLKLRENGVWGREMAQEDLARLRAVVDLGRGA